MDELHLSANLRTMSYKQICPCRFCGDSFSPQGHYGHETFCDENPHQGVPYDQQEALGVGPGAEDPDPPTGEERSRAGESDDGLPPVQMLSREKKPREAPSECPLCGGEAMDASEALDAYREAVETPHPRAIRAYRLADHACEEPDCAALWGDEFPEPVPMQVVVQQ